jgi:hypothetical protein
MIFFMLYNVILCVRSALPYARIDAIDAPLILWIGAQLNASPTQYVGDVTLELYLLDDCHRDWMNVFVSSNA